MATFEHYLITLGERDRINLCRFRCGNHRLPVKQQRYLTTNDYLPCPLCESNEPGDEFHYTLVCPAFSLMRSKYLKRYYYTRPNTLKLCQLFNTKNSKELSNLSKYVGLMMGSFLYAVLRQFVEKLYLFFSYFVLN